MRSGNDKVFVFRQRELPVIFAVFLILGMLAFGEMVMEKVFGQAEVGKSSPVTEQAVQVGTQPGSSQQGT